MVAPLILAYARLVLRGFRTTYRSSRLLRRRSLPRCGIVARHYFATVALGVKGAEWPRHQSNRRCRDAVPTLATPHSESNGELREITNMDQSEGWTHSAGFPAFGKVLAFCFCFSGASLFERLSLFVLFHFFCYLFHYF